MNTSRGALYLLQQMKYPVSSKMNAMRDRRHFIIISVAALFAILPLIFAGNSCGHDFEFHLFNWMEVGSQWKQGALFPHWEFTAAWNSGEPRFIFYPPLSWILGAVLGLLLPWAVVPGALIWIALTACGLTMYRLAREWTSEGNAMIAACLYIVHPYMLFTFYERCAYAELLAAAWLPLLLLAILRPRLTILAIALPIALLWLTNNPAAVMGCYTLALLSSLRIAWKWRTARPQAMKEAAIIVAGTCTGMAFAGFYLVPAIYERSWVDIRMLVVEGVRVQDNFLFGQFGGPSHRAILRTVSLCSVTLLIFIAVFAIVGLLGNQKSGDAESGDIQQGHRRRAVVALLLLAGFIGFLLTAPSAFLWRHLPELKNLQFPWRFDAVLGCVAAALLALALCRVRLRFSIAAAIALAAPLLLSMGGNELFRQSCNRGNQVANLLADFYRGDAYDSTDEYTPAGSDGFAVGHANPNAWLAAHPTDAAAEGVPRRYSVALADRLHFDISSPEPQFLVINLRDYPAWRIAMNGVGVRSHPRRADGLIALPIAAGRSKIDIAYALTWDRIAGWILTAVTIGGIFVLWRKKRSLIPWNGLQSAS